MENESCSSNQPVGSRSTSNSDASSVNSRQSKARSRGSRHSDTGSVNSRQSKARSRVSRHSDASSVNSRQSKARSRVSRQSDASSVNSRQSKARSRGSRHSDTGSVNSRQSKARSRVSRHSSKSYSSNNATNLQTQQRRRSSGSNVSRHSKRSNTKTNDSIPVFWLLVPLAVLAVFELLRMIPTSTHTTSRASSSLSQAFVKSAMMVVATEIGDKTFFMAGILAVLHPRLVVFAAAWGALVAMTIFSSVIGAATSSLIPPIVIKVLSTSLFLVFGVKLLREGWEGIEAEKEKEKKEKRRSRRSNSATSLHSKQSIDENEELVEAEAEVAALQGTIEEEKKELAATMMILFQTVFLAEWGDRSQVSTVAMASEMNQLGVILGGIVGHAMCTGLAVMAGRAIFSSLNDTHIAIAGGVTMMVFGVHSLAGILVG